MEFGRTTFRKQVTVNYSLIYFLNACLPILTVSFFLRLLCFMHLYVTPREHMISLDGNKEGILKLLILNKCWGK